MVTTTGEARVADLTAALRKAGLSEIDTAVRRRAEYSSDASNYRVVPSAVVFPRHAEEIEAALSVCRELGVPLVTRGAGTSIAGNALSAGVVLDTSRHLSQVLAVDPEARTAVVQPGTVLDSITRAAAPYGLRFGPDPSTHSRATIGGAIGNNACGSRALRYGRTADNVVELDLVTGAGVRFTARRYGVGLVRDPASAAVEAGGAEAPLLSELGALVGGNLAVIRTEFGRFTRQVSGYSLEHLLPESGADLAKFLSGTEGTLALTLGATVRLVDAPRATALAVLGYPDMATAAEAVPALLPHLPVALEGLDSRMVDLFRDRRGAAAVPELPRGGGWLFIETAGATEAEAADAARKLAADASCLGSAVITGPKAAALWRIREDGAGLGGRTPDGAPAWPGWEDSAVPPASLGPYLRELSPLMARHGVDGLLYGHFGDGCVHVRIDFPLRDRPAVLRAFVEDAAKLAASYGGSASGEHGDGRARGELLAAMYSPAAIGLFGAVKRLFDPANLLNPGVIVDPAPLDADLRVPLALPIRRGLGFAYPHDAGDFTAAVHRCTGVGKCRADNTASGGVMCPSYLATRDEKDSTRGRARVLQELANGSLVSAGWQAPEVAEVLDLCLSCKGCSSDCPAGVDMATYKAEALYQRYRRRLRPASHYSLGWLPRWAGLTARSPWLARLANASLRVAPVAALAKRLGGIDHRRDLPTFAPQSFRQWFAGRQQTATTARKPVLLWVDTFTNAFAPRVGQAAVRVLEDAGYEVRVTGQNVCCGLTWISTGQLDGARRQLRRTLRALQPALDAGIPIVGLEPSCTAALRGDAAELLHGDKQAAALAGAVRTLAELLSTTEGWRAPDLSGVTGIAQPHCHQHAVLGWDADAALLRDAGAAISAVGGCCGLAGNFGVERGHYEVSVAVAETALLPAVRKAGKKATVLADGFSCRTQLDQLAGIPGAHLAELLASRLDQ
ncbi:FAD-binding oxidoreductase [Trebonia kvetii]|uniref:FAD-binding oxidoreductase n=1 Tax=Trebonia kvetii TaxID=2480626 RepID=A0A6P2BYM8_9ACTN|nr:FAD-binding and (Fe-S)-binding domain-containing protein [Trebonia kvetii]TVZ03331.1 FAD-binding oxidoreductase [Trebonia kvetii]